MRTLDYETPEDLRRIRLIREIVQETQMSKRLELLREYEEEDGEQ